MSKDTNILDKTSNNGHSTEKIFYHSRIKALGVKMTSIRCTD